MATKLVQDSSIISLADAIRTKCGTSELLEFPTDFVTAIQNIPTGGGGGFPRLSGVNFIDYDGSLVQHYTADEFASLTAFPANPSHSGLTAQGWNWSLANAKAYVAKYGSLNIGQMYTTTSGKTEIDISLQDGRLSIACGIGLNGTMEIDWGDGSTPDTVTGTNIYSILYRDHTYAVAGEYTIKLDITGRVSLSGTSSSGPHLITKPTTVSATNIRYYANSIQAIRIGEGVTSVGGYAFYNCSSLASVTIPKEVTSIDGYAFGNCASLASVTIPEGVTSISSGMFYYCYSLASVTIPEGVTSIGTSAFSGCSSLASVTIPEGVTSIDGYTFQRCYSLASVIIPEGVTSIGTSAFSGCSSLASVMIPEGVTNISGNVLYDCSSLASVTIPEGVTNISGNVLYDCYSLAYIRLLPTIVPTLDINAFHGIPEDCVLYVPSASLADYQAATYWSDYASRMVGE